MGRTTLAACLAVLLALYVQSDAAKSDEYHAIGNLHVTIHGETLFTTDLDMDRPVTKALECHAHEGNDRANIILPKHAQFRRQQDEKILVADIAMNKKALLHFGQAKAESAGMWRCEITLPNGKIINGNMYAYSHPVFKNNESWPLTKSQDDASTAIGPDVYAAYETVGRISCPVMGYPVPQVTWFKDNFPLELGGRVTFNKKTGVLSIEGIKDEDAGLYRCEASNQFPVVLEGPEQYFVSKLQQKLVVGDNYGWMLPLAIILIILLLLFLIIFTCQRCSKYKADQYNVADRERALHNDQVPLKNSV